jgi:TIR domain
VISGWHKRLIKAGTERDDAIHSHLETSQIILLLVSSDFLDSDYCYDIEVRRAMQRHNNREARVIPILLRPVDWEYAPFGNLTPLPRNGQAVTSWENRDEAFLDISLGIRNVISEVNQKGGIKSESAWEIKFKASISDTDFNRALSFITELKSLSEIDSIEINRITKH